MDTLALFRATGREEGGAGGGGGGGGGVGQTQAIEAGLWMATQCGTGPEANGAEDGPPTRLAVRLALVEVRHLCACSRPINASVARANIRRSCLPRHNKHIGN